MSSRGRLLVSGALFLVAGVAIAYVARPSVTSHLTQESRLGIPRDSAALLRVIDLPGTLEVTSVASADWVVPRSGLIDLKDPRAVDAGLTQGLEPIQIFFHAIRHPQQGLFLVDSGVEKAFRDAPTQALLVPGPITKKALHLDQLRIREPLGPWLEAQGTPLKGIFLTHLHLDHVLGLRDTPPGAAVYVGPREAQSRTMMNYVGRSVVDTALESKGPLNEWPFELHPADRFPGVVDVFGDGQLWALWTPGHTPGSVAYLARTPGGPVLMTGDTSHSAWGWRNQVPPCSYTMDRQANLRSLAALEQLVREHPSISVRPGHQSL